MRLLQHALSAFDRTLPDALFIVLGPESSGTKLATRLLIDGGAVGSSEHAQPFDTVPFPDRGKHVIRRSVPHNTEQLFQTLPAVLSRRETNNVAFVVTIRDVECTAFSQVNNAHKSVYRAAFAAVNGAYGEIFSTLYGRLRAEQSTYLLSYEELTCDPELKISELCKWCGLEGNINTSYPKARQAKRYEEQRWSVINSEV